MRQAAQTAERINGLARVRRWTEGALTVALGLGLTIALLSYDPADPSLNVATGAAAGNWLGVAGAFWSDAGLQLLGLGAGVPGLVAIALGIRRLSGQAVRRPGRLALCAALSALFAALAFGAVELGLRLPAGAGGALGGWGSAATVPLVAGIGWGLGESGAATLVTGVAALLSAVSGLLAAGLGGADWRALRRAIAARSAERFDRERPERERPRARGPVPVLDAEEEDEPQAVAEPAPRRAAEARVARAAAAPRPAPEADRRPAKVEPVRPREQFALPLDPNAGSPALPPLALLRNPPPPSADVDPAVLQENARQLEQVLDDYGVEGEIIHVRAGPVVTMYELEPAAGIKASRVIGLADDIARSMSAVSARVAVVPGRTIIGIELPNAHRETVSLTELLASPAYQDAKPVLPLVLGKNIAGDPVVADLSPMPHLLIAGTTGSGKSVGLNAMILSLLYRLGPEQCRLIMIDPKQLELSVYNHIPHLLAPVVTEPQKAIRALKWAVEQMEERYRMMASINVRSLANFNQRVRDARVDGQPFVRRVQSGFDPETGLPVYEEQSFDYEPLPHIVIVVDELADLMMVAGKEIEFLIQRLAQKARAAGIHLIMATQRPSVDVITGVIKANLPTRISFQVTSKIDSRTILGEQGAEQLLGKGDMLYMPGGKQVVRVHGPFVSDEEVEAVADHWRKQGRPNYDDSVTEDPLPGEDLLGLSAAGSSMGGEDTDLLTQAQQIVAESQKASTSYLQRRLRIGYNGAARLIEQLEQMGIISQPDHVGRREVLVDRDGNRL